MTDRPKAGGRSREGSGRAHPPKTRPPEHTSGAPYPPGERHELGQDRKAPRVPTAEAPDEHEDHEGDEHA